jgi:hypothetical protein
MRDPVQPGAEHAAPTNAFFQNSFPHPEAGNDLIPPAIVDAAAMDFEPWNPVEGWEPPGRDNWRDHSQQFLMLRIAWGMVFRPKADVVEFVRSLWFDEETQDQELVKLIDGFRDADGYFQALHEIITAAQARLLSATSAVVLEQVGEQGND